MKKYILGVALIIAAILTCVVVPYFDSDPGTAVDIPGAIDGVKKGVETIKTDSVQEAK